MISYRFIYVVVAFTLLISCKVKKELPKIDIIDNSFQFTNLYSDALISKMNGKYEVAKNQFDNCLRLKPKSSASAYQNADINYILENYEEAKKYSEIAIRLKSDNEWYLLQRAQIADKLGEKKIRLNLYENLVKINKTNLSYKYELAIIYYELKEYEQSLALLRIIEEQIGINENISFVKNHIFYEQKRYDALQLELINLKNAYPDSVKYSDMLAEFYIQFDNSHKALNIYKEQLKEDSTNIESLYGTALTYAKIKEFNKGYPFLEKVLINDDIKFERKVKVANFYLNSKNGQLTEKQLYAIYMYLVDSKDVTIDVLEGYVGFLIKNKELSKAEKYSLVSIERFPDNYNSWEYYFNVLLAQNRTEALNKYALKALEFFPNQALVYFYTGYSFFLLKDFKEAVNYLEMGLDYLVDNKELELQFYLTAAESYHSLGKHEKSDGYFEKYLALDSTNAYLMNNYAYYLIQRNFNIQKALDLSRKSIEIEPFNSSFLDTYSWILYTMSEYSKALNYIQRAYKYGGNKNPIILEHYGDILMKNQNSTEAVEKWREAYNISEKEHLLKKINQVNN